MSNPLQILGSAKSVIITIFLIVLFLVAIYFAGKWSASTPRPKEVKLPADLDEDSGKYWNPGPITDGLYEDIYAGPFSTRNVKPYRDALQLSNSKLAAVMNDWNRRYFKKDNETLSDAISGEFFSFFDTSFRVIRDQLSARLKTVEQLQKK